MQVHYTRKSLAKIQVFNWERRKKATTNVHLHSLATLFGTPCQYWVGPTFAFRTAVILRGRDLTRCWKHSSEILVHFDMIASRSCCRFVGCTSMMWISRSTTSQRCSIGLRSGDCGGHLSKVNILVMFKKPVWNYLNFATSEDEQFLKYSDQPVWHQQPFHVQSHLNPLSSLQGVNLFPY